MFYCIDSKNNVEHYFAYHVSLFLHFGKMGCFLFIFQKVGFKPLFSGYFAYYACFFLTKLLIGGLDNYKKPNKVNRLKRNKKSLAVRLRIKRWCTEYPQLLPSNLRFD